MKNTLYLSLFLVSFVFTSCQKEETPVVQNPATVSQRDITIDYHIYAASGSFKTTYLFPNGDKMELTSLNGNRIDQTITFNWKSGNTFSLEAANASPSSDEVVVEIFVDGVLFKSATANAPGAVAKAEGFVN